MSTPKAPLVKEKLVKVRENFINQLSGRKNELNALEESKFNEYLEKATSEFNMMAEKAANVIMIN